MRWRGVVTSEGQELWTGNVHHASPNQAYADAVRAIQNFKWQTTHKTLNIEIRGGE